MTTYLSKNVGKALFPNLRRERRKKLLSRLILVLMASLFVTASLVMWMLHAIKHVKQSDTDFTINM
ncbi:MAG: hypothetical protein WAO02_00690 [Verrucomicrobiia bacterium]